MDDDHLLEAMVFAVQQYLDFDDDYDARIVNPYRTVVRRRWVVISIVVVQYCNDVCFRYVLRDGYNHGDKSPRFATLGTIRRQNYSRSIECRDM